MEVLDKLIVKGKSHKGKNRVRELGDEWVVVAKHPVHGTMITPLAHVGRRDGHLRWLKVNDQDFEIIKEA